MGNGFELDAGKTHISTLGLHFGISLLVMFSHLNLDKECWLMGDMRCQEISDRQQLGIGSRARLAAACARVTGDC